MNKTEKKFEKDLIKSLTVCCEAFESSVGGFEWLTHTLDFSNIDRSIRVICVFSDNENLSNAIDQDHITHMTNSIAQCLKKLGINLKQPSKHIIFDSEENCTLLNKGNWQERINQRHN